MREEAAATAMSDRDDVALLEKAAETSGRLRGEIGRVIVGQDEVVRLLLAAVLAEGHALVIGVPGLAKTLLVRTLAGALGFGFKRIQFTPDMMPADIIGMEMLEEGDGVGGEGGGRGGRVWRFREGPLFSQMVLADEINRTPPKTQAALLEAMAERTVTSMGRTHEMGRPFMVVATQNPIEQEGTYPLPEAQLDRFMFSLNVGYPGRAEEEAIVAATTDEREAAVEAVTDSAAMVELAGLVRRVPASAHVMGYAVGLARATRPDDETAIGAVRDYVEWGAGPRAAQHLVLAGKALAAMDGRPAVGADHIREAAGAVLGHRVLVNYRAAGEGVKAADVIGRVLDEVGEPEYGP